jgi:hypothetical protein
VSATPYAYTALANSRPTSPFEIIKMRESPEYYGVKKLLSSNRVNHMESQLVIENDVTEYGKNLLSNILDENNAIFCFTQS